MFDYCSTTGIRLLYAQLEFPTFPHFLERAQNYYERLSLLVEGTNNPELLLWANDIVMFPDKVPSSEAMVEVHSADLVCLGNREHNFCFQAASPWDALTVAHRLNTQWLATDISVKAFVDFHRLVRVVAT